MPIVADASAAVRADLRPFEQDLKSSKATKPVEGFGARIKSTLGSAFSPAAFIGGFVGGFAALNAGKVVDFVGDTITAASDLNETISKTGQILGEEAVPGLEAWAETAAESFGQSKRQALDAASTFAIFGKSAGLAGDDLTNFSTDLSELASDLASFFNTSPEDAITAIGAALRGESEPIRRYGVLLDDATLRQRALKLGIVETTKQALTPQQRVLAAQAEIFAQTADAQGDFARTSDGAANKMRILQARIENLQAELGEKLLPVFSDVLDSANELVDGLGELGGVLDTIGGAFAGVEDAVAKAGDAYRDMGIELDPGKWAVAIHNFVDDAARSLLGLPPAIRQAEDAATSMSQGWAEAWRDATKATEDGGHDVVDATGAVMDDATGAAADGAAAVADEIGKIPELGADEILDNQFHIDDAIDELNEFMRRALSPQEEINRLQGFLNSKALARGLASNNPLIRQKAEEMRDEVIQKLDDLGVVGYNAGANVSKGVAYGIDAYAFTARAAAGRLTAGVSGFLPINSPPENKQSPLANLYNVGNNIVDAIADGILGRVGYAQAATRSLSRALMPTIPTVAAGVGVSSSPAGGGGGGDVTNVYLPGRTRRLTAADFAGDLRRLEYGGKIHVKRKAPDD